MRMRPTWACSSRATALRPSAAAEASLVEAVCSWTVADISAALSACSSPIWAMAAALSFTRVSA